MENKGNYSKQIFIILIFLAAVVFFAVLKFTYSFTMPVAFAFILALVYYPIMRKLHKIRIPWTVSMILLLIITAVLLVVIGRLLVSSAEAIVSSYPKYESKFMTIYRFFADKLNLEYDENISLFNNLWNSEKIRSMAQNAAISMGANVFSGGKYFMIIFLLLIFLLLEVRSFKDKAQTALEDTSLKGKVPNLIQGIVQDVTSYLSIKFAVSLLTGILVYLSTLVIKMDFPIIWGFLAFILNFIPTFGSIISWLITWAFALLQFFPHWGYPVYVAAIVLLINQVIGNFLEPRIEGKGLGLSPFIILVSLSLWGYIWGFVGMFLAVPFTVIIKIIFENIEFLKPIAVFMGNNRDLKRHMLRKRKARKENEKTNSCEG